MPLLVAGLCLCVTAGATETMPSSVSVENARMTRNAGLMTVSMDLNLSQMDVESNRAVVFVPMIVKGEQRKELPAVGVYGRTRWYQYQRSGREAVGGADETSYRYSRRPSVVEYSRIVPYEQWMDGSQLILSRREYGCCSELGTQSVVELGSFANAEKVYTPAVHYVRPTAEVVKSRTLSGNAFIDFPVNRAELIPDYRGNRAEIAKIIATIDSVRNDRDITVTSLTIKGYASPEDSYERNARLAKARTEALKNYVSMLYNFGENFIKTDYEPEDWAGLRARVSESTLPHRREILEIIDDRSLEPDAKEWRIKSRYPEDYRVMLDVYYPALRHSDYSIVYTVCDYNNVDKIREIMATAPQKLSLEEMYTLAESYEKGSEEYVEVFETAVRMFPNDETANLNAANAALSRGDLRRAERYLEKAGASAEAIYARGILAGMQGDLTHAEQLLRVAAKQGITGTDEALERLRNRE